MFLAFVIAVKQNKLRAVRVTVILTLLRLFHRLLGGSLYEVAGLPVTLKILSDIVWIFFVKSSLKML